MKSICRPGVYNQCCDGPTLCQRSTSFSVLSTLLGRERRSQVRTCNFEQQNWHETVRSRTVRKYCQVSRFNFFENFEI